MVTYVVHVIPHLHGKEALLKNFEVRHVRPVQMCFLLSLLVLRMQYLKQFTFSIAIGSSANVVFQTK